MSGQHTPGPWAFQLADVPYAELGESWTVDSEWGGLCTLDCPKDAREANARLIAAAPELLEALEDICASYEAYRRRNGDDADSSDSIEIARAAVAKATGA